LGFFVIYLGIVRCHSTEKTMWKAVLAGSTALMIAGSSLAYAQQPAAKGNDQRWRPGAEDFAAFTDARVAALKAGLKLTAEQEKNWPAVETAVRETAKQRTDRMKERREGQRPADPIARLRQQADMMTERAADLKRLADASEPLYKSLDDGQKRRFVALARVHGQGMMRAHHGGTGHRGPGAEGPRGEQRPQ
jgi:zinc resistance-associated protein